jgi:hypothetical protein
MSGNTRSKKNPKDTLTTTQLARDPAETDVFITDAKLIEIVNKYIQAFYYDASYKVPTFDLTYKSMFKHGKISVDCSWKQLNPQEGSEPRVYTATMNIDPQICTCQMSEEILEKFNKQWQYIHKNIDHHTWKTTQKQTRPIILRKPSKE